MVCYHFTFGSGIIDPADQNRALLGKLIVRGLLPGDEPWKVLLLQRIQTRAPLTGGPWALETCWIFTEMRRTGLSRGWEDRFAMGILRAWELLRSGLTQREPQCACFGSSLCQLPCHPPPKMVLQEGKEDCLNMLRPGHLIQAFFKSCYLCASSPYCSTLPLSYFDNR